MAIHFLDMGVDLACLDSLSMHWQWLHVPNLDWLFEVDGTMWGSGLVLDLAIPFAQMAVSCEMEALTLNCMFALVAQGSAYHVGLYSTLG